MQEVAKKSKEKLPKRFQVVADIIPLGSSKAILLDDIMIVADIKERRQAYIIIEELIVKFGYPIAASKKGVKGYYYPSNQRELEAAANTLKSSITSLKKRHASLINNYKESVKLKGG